MHTCNRGQIIYSSTFRSRMNEAYLRFEERLLARPFVFIFVMCLIGGYLGYYVSNCLCMLVPIPLIILILNRMFCREFALSTRLLMGIGMILLITFIIGFRLWINFALGLPQSEQYSGSAVVCSADCHQEGYKNILLELPNGEKVVFLTDQRFDYGATIEINCDLELITTSGNPGDVDIRDFYNRQGIVRSANSVLISSLSSKTKSPICVGYRLGAWISEKTHEYWAEITNQQVSSFLSAMVTGNDQYLDRAEKEVFSKSNLAHLLVVSGAHVGYFSSTLLTLISLFTNERRKKLVFVMFMLIVYGFLCGWSGSATRSIIMYLLMSGISMIDKAADKLSICAASAVIMIVLDPFAMFSTGVLLSFGATLSITVFQKRVENRFRNMLTDLPEELICAVSCFLCAQVGMLPILISLGSSYSIINILVILLAGFPAEVICSMGLVLTLISLLIPIKIIKRILFIPIAGLIKFLVSLSNIGTLQTMDRTKLSEFPAVLWIALVGIFLSWVIPSGLRRMIVASVTSLSVLLFVIQIPCMNKNECDVYFLDVGQGDCTLISYQSVNILIDGGNIGCGEKIRSVMDFLNIDKIDLALMSHLDIDHVGGILELWNMGYISALYAPFWGDSTEMSELKRCYQELPENVNILRQNIEISIDSHLSIQCIWPSNPQTGGNEDSLVLLARIFDVTVVFTGDIDETVEQQLQLPEYQTIHVLKIAHHGSRYSTSEYFLKQNFIDAAVISVGYNHYGHPTQEVLDRLDQFDIPYYRTDEGGCAVLHVCDDEWSIRYYFDR